MTEPRRSSRLASSPIRAMDLSSTTRPKRRASDQAGPMSDDSGIGMQTPSKPNKRVRFSDVANASPSSGLTQQVRRTTLSLKTSTAPMTPTKRGRGRLSLSADLPTPPSSPMSEVRILQFTPMRQALTPRVRRRLRRSHLSEVQNEILAEQRSEKREHQEQVQALQAQIKTLTWELEQQRQLGVQVEGEEQQRITELEHQLRDLKQRQSHHEDALQTASPAPTDGDTIFDTPSVHRSMHLDWNDEQRPSSPLAPGFSAPDSPISWGFEHLTEQPTTSDNGVQAMLPNQDHVAQIAALEGMKVQLERQTTGAKTAFETVCNMLVQLGFAPTAEDEDVSSALRTTIRSTRMRLEDILPGETVCGIEDGRLLLDELINHIQCLISTNMSSTANADLAQRSEAAMRKQFNDTLGEKQSLNERISVMEAYRAELVATIAKLQDDLEACEKKFQAQAGETQRANEENTRLHGVNEDQATTIDRQSAALNRYRDELASLEGIVGALEEEGAAKDTKTDDLRSRLEVTEGKLADCNTEISRLHKGLDDFAYTIVKLKTPGLENVTVRAPKNSAKSGGQSSTASEEESCEG